jgi:hypothetical protein
MLSTPMLHYAVLKNPLFAAILSRMNPGQPLSSLYIPFYNTNNLLTASGLSPGGSGYFTFKLRQTY